MTEPKIRFKADDGSDFPDWDEKKLEDVVEFLDGKRKPIEAGEREAGIYPYYGASGIVDYVKDYIFDEDLILLSEDGANIIDRNSRVCFMARGKYWVNNHAHVLKAIKGNVNEFICEQLESFDYSSYNTGSAQPKINQKVCRNLRLNIPHPDEQQLIADFLSNVDEVIAASEEEVANLEQQKKAVMQKIFSQEVRFKKEDGSDFPDWEEKCFDELYQKITEKNDLSFGAESIISVANMYFREDTGADALMPDYMKTYNVMRLGDIAFEGNKSKYFKYGRFVENTIGDGIVSHVFDVFRPLKPLNLMFWKTLINYEPVMGKILAKCTKSSTMMTNLDSKAFLKQGVSVPCETEQQLIADFFTSYDEAITAAKQELAKWKELKKGLLQQMFV